MSEVVVGIDLGTTNSEVAAWVGGGGLGRVEVLGPPEGRILPSCVGLTPSGELLVGRPARNQLLLYPERTVKSIKRKMGQDVQVALGDQSFTPQELSALILRHLVEVAAQSLGERPARAVITVPAYFSDAQRQATREAGALAGLEVARILNEPTAASLAYGGDGGRRTLMVYDLGGGTFDVSIVRIEGEVTEVLASHGNNQLGGDDFDLLLAERLARRFQDEHGIDLRQGHAAAWSRLFWAAEEAKRRLSDEPYAVVREEALVTRDGRALHLEHELSREDYEGLIAPLVESTLQSVSHALDDAGLKPRQLDGILLVGGSTRTPLVARVLEQRTGLQPRHEVHPELCVALGAGVLASRVAGHDVERVLVDVSPYSFGPSHLGERGGALYPHCYSPIIRRNTPLPVTRTERYFTVYPEQTSVELRIYQGDDPDALRNILVGDFRVTGLTPRDGEPIEVLCRMGLGMDGMLEVAAIEKHTGKSKQVTIAHALAPKSEAEVQAAKDRLRRLYSSGAVHGTFEGGASDEEAALDLAGAGRHEVSDGDLEAPEDQPEESALPAAEAHGLVERSRSMLSRMHEQDREEAVELHEAIESALAGGDAAALAESCRALRELLFFVEGR